MVAASGDAGMDAVLLPNGDVHAAGDHGYLLGSILRSGEVPGGQSLVVEMNIAELGQPTVPILDTMGWRVRVVEGQGDEPAHGRSNGVELRVVRPSED